ncbi:hypothetical protein F4808DRAFT_412432 [Astrocystis sublimbata]|nr:hypothetical protein F4808DRAFT_412432 [Astrocystis sublimbata]
MVHLLLSGPSHPKLQLPSTLALRLTTLTALITLITLITRATLTTLRITLTTLLITLTTLRITSTTLIPNLQNLRAPTPPSRRQQRQMKGNVSSQTPLSTG